MASVEYGIDFPLQDLQIGTTIKCPFHIPDNKASAFTLKSSGGVLGVHCLVCKTTFFTSNDIPIHNFNYDLNNLKRLEAYSSNKRDGEAGSYKQNITRINQRYLSDYKISGNLIFVRSPKGSGKTVWLENVVKEDNDTEERMWTKIGRPNKASERWNGAILIGHRRSLITSLADRLQLYPYIEHAHIYTKQKYLTEQKFNRPQPYYAICADSLSMLVDTEYHWWPIVIIDEVEQVLKHLTSDTLKYRRNNTFQVFKYIINSARQVYLMDADLNELTVESIYQLIDDKHKSVSLVVNEYKVKDKEINLYASKDHLESDLIKSIRANKRCYVCSNSMTKVLKMTALLMEEFGDSKKILSITSKNSHKQDIQSFIKDVSTKILKYDVVLSSPTLGTGIDITFEDDKQEIDCVFGLFEQRVNTHFDIDQQLSRVRNPKQINVWVSPETLRFETNPLVIKREMEGSHAKFRHIVNISEDGVKKYNDDGYHDLYSNVRSQQLASKNHLLTHFIKLRKHNGWKINDIEKDEAVIEEISAMKKRAEETLEKRETARLMVSKIITREENNILRRASDSHPLTDDQIYAMRRYAIESFYLEHIDEDLVAMDNNRLLRAQLFEYQLLMSSEDEIKKKDIHDEKELVSFPDRKSRLHRKKLYKNILIKSKLMDNNYQFNTIDPIKKTDLDEFVKYIKANKLSMERLFEIHIRKGVDRNPMQQLKRYLARLGILMDEAVPKKRSDGGKDYLYTLSHERILYLNDMNAKRNDEAISKKWHDERNHITKNRLFPEWDPEGALDFDDFIRDQIKKQIVESETDDWQ